MKTGHLRESTTLSSEIREEVHPVIDRWHIEVSYQDAIGFSGMFFTSLTRVNLEGYWVTYNFTYNKKGFFVLCLTFGSTSSITCIDHSPFGP